METSAYIDAAARPAAPERVTRVAWLLGASQLPDGFFSLRARRRGMAWVTVGVIATMIWSVRVDGTSRFFAIWVLSSGLFTTPALVVTAKVARRAQGDLRGFWRAFFAAVAGVYVTGLFILLYVALAWSPGRVGALMWASWSVGAYSVSVWRVVQMRSGGRSLWVDQIEILLAVIALGGPTLMVLGPRLTGGPEPWFTVSCGVTLLFAIAAVWSTVVNWMRSDRGNRLTEAIGVGLGAVTVADSFVLALHSASGFALPNAPVLGLHAVAMGLLLILPLHAGRQQPLGLRRLPPEAQIRTSWFLAVILVLSLSGLAAAAYATRDQLPWAVGVSVGTLALLVVCSAARQLVTTRETKALYAEVERSAAARRRLLAEVLQSVESDRRLVAAQLHEQAASSYAAFASFAQATATRTPSSPGAGTDRATMASAAVRNRLAAQAEALRELTAAIQPLSATRGHDGLGPLVRAYADSLWGAARPPVIEVEVAPGLVLDWITETVALRIVQEAVANVWRHAAASRVVVSLGADDGFVTVRVADDGLGFDPDTVPTESGVATMRRFVAFCDGDVHITSRAGHGTVVEALLGPAPRPAPTKPNAERPPRLRLVEGS